MSQAALAEAMQAAGATNWHQTTVSRVENGTQTLTLSDMAVLRIVLGDIAGTAEGGALPAVSTEGLLEARDKLTGVLGRLRDVTAEVDDALGFVERMIQRANVNQEIDDAERDMIDLAARLHASESADSGHA